MAAANIPEIGTGTTITFEGASTFFARVNSLDWGGFSRESIETTHLGTATARTFMPGDLYDPGELTVSLQHGLDATLPSINGSSQNIIIEFPAHTLANGAKWSAFGFMTGYDINIALEERIDATCTLKFTGAISQDDEVA